MNMGKGQYYNECDNADFDLVTTDESSCSGEWEAESHNDSTPHEIFFCKRKKHFDIFRQIINFCQCLHRLKIVQ